MPKRKTAWTVMVYLAGDNNLTSECLFALTEMKKAKPGDEINVIAQFDPRDEYLATHRYEINRKGAEGALFDDIIGEARYNSLSREVRFKRESKNADRLAWSRLNKKRIVNSVQSLTSDLSSLPYEETPTTDETDTGSPVTLYNFVSYCIQEYPAHHYMLVLSGHAGGTDSDFFMQDESHRGSLTFNEIRQVLKELRTDLKEQTIDIIGMDNCLMSMSEICYELRGLTQIVVGCESYSPASGWPYRPILERLRDDFTDSNLIGKRSLAVAAAKAIVEEYVNYYSVFWLAGVSVSQSALDLEYVERLKELVDALGSSLTEELKKDHRSNGGKQRRFTSDLLLAHWEAQSYNGEWYVDLYDFCHRLENRVSNARVKRRCRELKAFIKNKFVLKSCYSGAAYQYSHGVSIYFPWSEVSGSYRYLDFAAESRQSGWLTFLRTYTLLTRRAPRGVPNEARFVRRSFELLETARAAADRIMSDRIISDRIMSDRIMSDRIMSDRIMSDRIMSDRIMSDRIMSDRIMSDRMLSGFSKNPIRSMRNPPIIFLPDECIRQASKIRAAVDRFFPYTSLNGHKRRAKVQRKPRRSSKRDKSASTGRK